MCLKGSLVPKRGLNRYNSALNELIDIKTRRDNKIIVIYVIFYCKHAQILFIMRENDIRTSNISKVKKLNNKFVEGFASITFSFRRLRY